MQKKHNRIKDYIEFLIPVVIMAIFSLWIAGLYQISWKNGFSFFVFQIGGILLPGMGMILLINWKTMSRLELFAFSYAVGYGLNIVSYYLTVPFGLQNFLQYLILAEAVAGIIMIIKKREHIKQLESDRMGGLFCCVLIVFYLVIQSFTVCAANFFPPLVEENSVYHDLLYWIGNTITLMRGYPAMSFREYPQYPYTYHFFSSMQLSVIAIVTNIRPVFLGFGFSVIQPAIIMITGAYVLLRKITAKKALILFAMIAVFFTEGKVDLTRVAVIYKLLVAQFGFDIGMGFYLFFFYTLWLQWKQEKFDLKLCCMTIFFFVLTLGSKSPFGAMALGAAGILCLVWLFRKQFQKAFAYGIPLVISFILMYLFVVNLGSSDQPEASLMQTILNSEPFIYWISPYLRLTHENLLAFFGDRALFRPLVELLTGTIALILSNYCIFLSFIYLLFMKVIKVRRWDGFDTACMAVIVVGTVITMNWGNPDSSVVYFMMTAYIPAVLFSVRTAEQLYAVEGYWKGVRKAGLTTLFAGIMLCGIVDTYQQSDGYSYSLKKGWKNITASQENSVDPKDRSYICTDDYAAYEWIRCNTTEDTLVTVNVGLQRGRDEGSRYGRVPGVFTERYIVRNEDSDALFYDLDYSRIQDLKEMGIAYIIYNRTATPDFSLPEEAGEAVYENATNIIYKIK